MKNLPAMQETPVRRWVRKIPLEQGQAAHSSILGFSGGSAGKESTQNVGDRGSIPGLGRSPEGGNGNRPQYSCLENPTDRGAWRAAVREAAKRWTGLSHCAQHTQVAGHQATCSQVFPHRPPFSSVPREPPTAGLSTSSLLLRALLELLTGVSVRTLPKTDPVLAVSLILEKNDLRLTGAFTYSFETQNLQFSFPVTCNLNNRTAEHHHPF